MDPHRGKQAPARFFRAIGVGGVFPSGPRREIVFCGRSNVGKSSLLNTLTGVKGLARTSKTPGRTRQVHYYEQGTDRYLVDLPGYGYAKVSLEERRSWGGLVESFLEHADAIALAILLVDSRHPPFEMDLGLADALESRDIPYVVALTKTDRATSSERSVAHRRAVGLFHAAQAVIPTSSKTAAGLKDLAACIDRSLGLGGKASGSRRGDPRAAVREPRQHSD